MSIAYVGIDVHKKDCTLFGICDGMKPKKCRTSSDPAIIVKTLKKWFGETKIESVYEAGFSGYKLHRVLRRNGIKNIVVDPSSIVKAPGDRVKTDNIDAKKLCQLLQKGMLKCIDIPKIGEVKLRNISRARQQLVKLRVQTGNMIKGFLMFNGLMDQGEKRLVGKNFLEYYEGKMDKLQKVAFGSLKTTWLELTDKIRQLQKELKSLSEEDPLMPIFMSIPGFGLITATTLRFELRDVCKRFSSQKKLYSYTGLTPCEYSSGDKVRKGGISRRGPARIRYLLVEAAWVAIRRDEGLNEKYQSIKARSNGKTAIVAIARILVGRLRACLLSGEEYCITE